MDLAHYTKNLFIILWNIIAFLCQFISHNIVKEKKITSFSVFVRVDKIFIAIYNILKELINKIKPKANNNNTAKNKADTKPINTNKNSKSNRVNFNNIGTNQAIKTLYSLHIKKLKDALATQNLISKHYFSRLWDKCAYLYPFLGKNHCSQYNL